MKIIDEKGLLFKKINVLDFIALIVILFFAFLLILNLSQKSLEGIGTSEKNVTSKIELSITMAPGYYDVLKVGDKLAEDKRYFDMVITNVRVVPFLVTTSDATGNTYTYEDPTQSVAYVTVEGELVQKGPIYKLGKQEVREGIRIFLEGELFKYQAIVTDFEVSE